MTTMRARRLPLRFDAPSMEAESARLAPESWRPHFNSGDHDGGWTALACDAAMLAGSPAIARALRTFRCPVGSVRLLRLAAGASIHEHRDDDLRIEGGEARVHVPVTSNGSVETYVDGLRVRMEPGECWVLNVALPHRVHNFGTADRIHLVVDCTIDDWLRTLMHAGTEADDEPGNSAQHQFLAFRAVVFAEPELAMQLLAIGDRAEFARTCVAQGAARGYAFTRDEVDAAMRAGRLSWLQHKTIGPG